ncbi:hypothetical protein P7C73_g5656, partial [Tremellales sp. Uapishka_1]
MSVTIRPIAVSQSLSLRQQVLHPSWPLEDQQFPYDHLPSTLHFGAFLESTPEPLEIDAVYWPEAGQSQQPIACLTLVHDTYTHAGPYNHIQTHIKLRKFAVLPSLQGRGIGRQLLEHGLDSLSSNSSRPTLVAPILLHFDARTKQKGFYEKMGMVVLDEKVFINYGNIEYVRMGTVLE